MGFQNDDNEDDYEITCPKCGSENVTVSRDEFGYMKIVRCKKCGFVSDD